MQNSRIGLVNLVLCCAVLALFIPAASAQAISGDLVGTVTDATAAAVPDVTVVAINTATGVRTTGVTNAAGQYRISNLPPGSYNVSAGAKGFATAELKNVAIELNKVATANIVLQVSDVNDLGERHRSAAFD